MFGTLGTVVVWEFGLAIGDWAYEPELNKPILAGHNLSRPAFRVKV